METKANEAAANDKGGSGSGSAGFGIIVGLLFFVSFNESIPSILLFDLLFESVSSSFLLEIGSVAVIVPVVTVVAIAVVSVVTVSVVVVVGGMADKG